MDFLAWLFMLFFDDCVLWLFLIFDMVIFTCVLWWFYNGCYRN